MQKIIIFLLAIPLVCFGQDAKDNKMKIFEVVGVIQEIKPAPKKDNRFEVIVKVLSNELGGKSDKLLSFHVDNRKQLGKVQVDPHKVYLFLFKDKSFKIFDKMFYPSYLDGKCPVCGKELQGFAWGHPDVELWISYYCPKHGLQDQVIELYSVVDE